MWLCLMLLDFACAFAPQVPDQIFADGVEPVHISIDRPTDIVWSINSTNANAAFVTSSTYLNDGKVAIPTRMTYDVGAQTTFSYTRVIGTVSGLTIPVNGIAVVAVLMPDTAYAIPAGVLIGGSFSIGGAGGISTSGHVVRLNNGANALFMVMVNNGFGAAPITPDTVQVVVWNNLNGSTWATSGQTFDIGEAWFGTLQEFKTATDPQYSLIDGTTNRRSHSNQPWPLYRKPYRQITTDLPPMSTSVAYTGTNNFDYTRNQLSQCSSCLVIPRLYTPGSTTSQATDDINQLSIFGRPESIGPLKRVANSKGGNDLWASSVTFSEAPP